MNLENFQVIYLTGPPASGKSTLSRALADLVAPLKVFEYGSRLTAFVAERVSSITQTSLREQSSAIVSPEDVAAVDRKLLDFVARERTRAHVIIDSHAVTKERYGFRVTPFKLEDFAILAPTQIWVAYVDSEEILRRISADAGGRPNISAWEADFHLQLQASVATTYGMHIGIPVHIVNTNLPVEGLARDLRKRFS